MELEALIMSSDDEIDKNLACYEDFNDGPIFSYQPPLYESVPTPNSILPKMEVGRIFDIDDYQIRDSIVS